MKFFYVMKKTPGYDEWLRVSHTHGTSTHMEMYSSQPGTREDLEEFLEADRNRLRYVECEISNPRNDGWVCEGFKEEAVNLRSQINEWEEMLECDMPSSPSP